jgi:hypothetical protein
MEQSTLLPFPKTQGNREKLINELKSLDHKNGMDKVDGSILESLLHTLNKATEDNNINDNIKLNTTAIVSLKQFINYNSDFRSNNNMAIVFGIKFIYSMFWGPFYLLS